jgi:hypothetical protein
MKASVYRPRFSSWIMGMYWAILIIFAAIVLAAVISSGTGSTVFFLLAVTFSAVTLLIALILMRAYTMKFTITTTHIVVQGVFRKNIIKRSDIKSIEKTPIPFGFRLFGASFLGGLYYLPGIGRAWVSMGNFEDGVLIATKQGNHYVITPERPHEFIRKAKAR